MIDEIYTIQLLSKLTDERALLSSEELAYLKDIFNSYQGRLFIESHMQKIWEEPSADNHNPNFDELYNKIEYMLKFKEEKQKQRRILYIVRQCAAILFIPLLGFSIFLFVRYSGGANDSIADGYESKGAVEYEYYAPAGNKSKITLPDSTYVWLNSGSRLMVDGSFGERQRRVKLSGEAYFEVRRNELRPFIVDASGMDITVLGTSFNISAYPDSDMIETVLVEGAIEVDTKKDIKGNSKITLVPAQKLALNRHNDEIILEDNVESDLYTAWKDNRLIYQDTPMEDVAKSLERWFNVEIMLHDGELKSHTYSGTFDNRSIDQIMRYIEASSPIKYEIDKERIDIYAKK